MMELLQHSSIACRRKRFDTSNRSLPCVEDDQHIYVARRLLRIAAGEEPIQVLAKRVSLLLDPALGSHHGDTGASAPAPPVPPPLTDQPWHPAVVMGQRRKQHE